MRRRTRSHTACRCPRFSSARRRSRSTSRPATNTVCASGQLVEAVEQFAAALSGDPGVLAIAEHLLQPGGRAEQPAQRALPVRPPRSPGSTSSRV